MRFGFMSLLSSDATRDAPTPRTNVAAPAQRDWNWKTHSPRGGPAPSGGRSRGVGPPRLREWPRINAPFSPVGPEEVAVLRRDGGPPGGQARPLRHQPDTAVEHAHHNAAGVSGARRVTGGAAAGALARGVATHLGLDQEQGGRGGGVARPRNAARLEAGEEDGAPV